MKACIGIDVGKTALRVGLFSSGLELVERWSTQAAEPVLSQAALQDKLREIAGRYEIASVGLSIFGPLQVGQDQPGFGAVIESSAPAWSGVNIPRLACDALQRDVWFDFDVNAGALAEAKAGGGKARASFVYLSIGTGIGAVSFRSAHVPGYAPQIGHMFVPREPDDSFAGSCRFHRACLQGLASGKAMAERWGQPAESLAGDHPAWDLEARYIARASANLVYTFAPEVVLLGSSVGSSPALSIADVNRYTLAMLNDFLEPGLRQRFSREAAVVRTALGPDSSLIGAMWLGKERSGLLYAWSGPPGEPGVTASQR